MTTLFKDKPRRLQDWLAREQKRASAVPEASNPERHQKPGVDYSKPSSNKTLRQIIAEVNHSETLYQIDADGIAATPGEKAPRIVPVIAVNPSSIVDASNSPIDLKKIPALRQWIKEKFQGVTVTIKDDGTIQKFSEKNLRASVKRRDTKQRKMYAELDKLLENALYDGQEKADERHKEAVAGQNIYYAAAEIGG